MEKWLTREWQQNSLWQIVLRPLSWLFALLAALRRFLYQAGIFSIHPAGVPVIVVGNIVVGGTGKTPLVIALVKHLQQAGYSPGVVSRGFGVHDTNLADEPQLIRHRLNIPVVSEKNRPAAAHTLRLAHPQVDVIVSDDGLQHYALSRDIEIAVVDARRGFGNGARLPAGPLREPVARLAEVDAIVVNEGKAGSEAKDLTRMLEKLGPPVFRMQLANESFVSLAQGQTLRIEQFVRAIAGKHLVAIAGIAHPPHFFEHLMRLGIVCQSTHAFPDHYLYRMQDLAFPEADVILMTEKDAVKCLPCTDSRLWAMRIDAVLPDELGQWVLKRLTDITVRKI